MAIGADQTGQARQPGTPGTDEAAKPRTGQTDGLGAGESQWRRPGLVTGGREWFEVGRFLGPNISGHYRRYPVSWTVEAWRKAGFTDVGVRVMSLGGGLVMWGTRAGG